MAKVKMIITGDKELTKRLHALGGKKAAEVNRKALRAMAKLGLERAKARVPVRSGAYKRSLTVRAGKRSRKGASARVTQRALRTVKGKQKPFYGGFLELGYTPTGRPRKEGSDVGEFIKGQVKTLVKSAEGKRDRKKIPARWIVRGAAKEVEPEAVRLYHTEIDRHITEAMK